MTLPPKPFTSTEPQPFQSDIETAPADPEAVKRAKKVVGDKAESTFAKNLRRMKRALGKKPDESAKFQLAEPYPFDCPWEIA